MIYVEPESGLCNRFRVIDSAMQLAKYRKTKVKVLWKVNHDVGGEFLELFENFSTDTGIVDVINDHTSDYFNIAYHKYFTRFRKFFKPELIDLPDWEAKEMFDKYGEMLFQLHTRENYYTEDFHKSLLAFWDEHWPGKNYYIRTYSRFFGTPRSDYRIFRPRKEILQKSEQITRHYKGAMVGVHIRRTDNIDATQASPTHKYIEEMEKELYINPATLFFLATDSESERNEILALFKEKVLFHESSLERGQLQGIKDALTELICLSKTNKILGSYCSSFTETAISYNGMKDYKIIQ